MRRDQNVVVGCLFLRRAPLRRGGSLAVCAVALPSFLAGGIAFRLSQPLVGWPLYAQCLFVAGTAVAIASLLHLGRSFAILPARREIVSRGEHAELQSGSRPFTEHERQAMWELISRVYDVFIDRVTASRGLTREAVDAIGGGRVWTGRQALERRLVDELGGLDLATRRAREEAGLGRRSKVVEVKAGKKLLAPVEAGPSAWLAYAHDGVRMFRPGVALTLCPLLPIDESF